VITVAPGKHRRPRHQATDDTALPAANQRTLLTDADWPPSGAGPWPPQWEGPPPLLHPDHPSAPVPRVRAPLAPGAGADGPAPARSPSLGVPRSRPNSGPPRGTGSRQGLARMQARSSLITPDAGPQPPGTAGSARQPGFGRGGQPAGIGHEPQNQATTIRQAGATIRQEATAIRKAAEQDAAAIRQEATAIRKAAEQDAAHLRTVILSLSEQLSQTSAYITGNLASPGGARAAGPAAATAALATAARTGPATSTTRPVTGPARPASRHARPVAKPGKSVTRPTTGTQGRGARAAHKMVALLARPAGLVGPTSPGTTPARKPQERTRQHRAMRVATAATATLFAFALVSAAVEIGTFGFKFFVFRTAVGESAPTVPTDQQFLAHEAAEAKAAAAKTAPQKAHTPGRHSAKDTRRSANSTSG
jgi:hypothetical protein